MTTSSELWASGPNDVYDFCPDGSGRVPIHVDNLRHLLERAGYERRPVITNHDHPDPGVATVGCCSPDAEPQAGMKSPPPGSVDLIVSHMRAELADLRAGPDDERLGRVQSIYDAEQELARCEEDAANASQRVDGKHQRVRDLELAIERLS